MPRTLPSSTRRLLALPLAALPLLGGTQEAASKPLADLSIEELGSLEVTSVSRRPERASEAAAAVFVITREDIRRSGASTVAEALRLAPNLEVAKVDAFTWAITARGFNSHNGNKLLVLVDGRTGYSPFFSGVWWDAQEVVLQDVERIEVISGPGGTLWGSNAVNGVINILTRSARDTRGTLVAAAAGKGPQSGTLRFGTALGNGAVRVYARSASQEDSKNPNGGPVGAGDAWHTAQAGFRADWGSRENAFTVQGDGYRNTLARTPAGPGIGDGGNLLGRWEHAWAEGHVTQAQVYLDRVRRDLPAILAEWTDTADVDLLDRFRLGDRHTLVWGGGYRSMDYHVRNSAILAFLPDHRKLGLGNVFAQDTVALAPGKLDLTLGAKLEHNDFTGSELQPNARLAWQPAPDQFVWAAVSRAVRTPALFDRDYHVPGNPPYLVAGGPHFVSEVVRAYEAGYRLQSPSGFSFSFSPFYNAYSHLRSLEPDPSHQGIFVLANEMEGKAWGAELWGEIPVTASWHLRPAYAYLRQDLRLTARSRDPLGTSPEGDDPRHRILLTSLLSLGGGVELDGTLRHVSALPDPPVPAYTTLDLHLGWRPRPGLELALTGQNLFAPEHLEFINAIPIERQAQVKVTWTF